LIWTLNKGLMFFHQSKSLFWDDPNLYLKGQNQILIMCTGKGAPTFMEHFFYIQYSFWIQKRTHLPISSSLPQNLKLTSSHSFHFLEIVTATTSQNIIFFNPYFPSHFHKPNHQSHHLKNVNKERLALLHLKPGFTRS
jgi:hypothetical protein